MDAAIQAQLDKMVTEVMASDEFKANAKKGSIFLLPMSGADYLAYLTDLQAETQAVFDTAPW
jgi:tripartite-type tricarboxylate transporter receptor subunit TctC